MVQQIRARRSKWHRKHTLKIIFRCWRFPLTGLEGGLCSYVIRLLREGARFFSS